MAPLCQTEQCFPSVILKLIHRQFFFHNLKSSAAAYYGIYCIDLSEQCAVGGPSGGHNAETEHRCIFINFVTTRSEILRRKPTVKTARTLRLCCVVCNCVEYCAAWDVLIDQVMYKLRSLVQCHCQNACHWLQL